MARLASGDTIAGYRIDSFVGRGGMGEVYRASEVESGRIVALKLIAAGGDGLEERFAREGAIAASLDHPHVVPVYGSGVDVGRSYIAMRFVEGTDLATVLAGGPLELGRALSILSQVAAALDAAHDRGLVHRDVKPGNVLIESRDGEEAAYLSDFGLVKEIVVDDSVTSTGMVLGTPDYLAPEQVLSGTADARSDVYALGCVLFQMLTGRVPFPRESEVARIWAHVNDDPPQLAELRPDLPEGLDAVVARAMAKEPEHRFGSAGDLARAAAAAVEGALPEGLRAVVVPEPERAAAACPYMGLAAFQPEDAEYFFGREELVRELAGRLGRARFLGVVGASGSGKSSLVRAGLLPALGNPFTVIAPGDRPLESLAGAGEGVLAVDQLEELFTLCRDDEEREEFIGRLLAWPEPVVVALRADFYGRCAEYPALGAALERSQALVGPMGEPELRRAIERPAQRVGLHLEHRLLETALHDVLGQPGALPLLSHALLETWKRRIGRTLTLGGYLEAGGVEGAVAKTAEEVYRALPDEQQPLARSIFLRLTALGEGTEDTRRRVAVSELVLREGEEPRVEAVLDRLVEARLLTRDDGVVEVAHEALIRHWPTLRAWLDEDREGRRVHRRLTEASQEWDALGREPSALYRGARFAAAAEWADANPDEPNELERAFLEASRAAEQSELDRTRRRNRRLRVLVGALALLLIGAAIAAVIAVRQTGQARDQEQAAEEQAQIAEEQAQIAQEQTELAQEQEQLALEREAVAVSRQLGSRSLDLLEDRLDQALLVGLEAYRTESTFEARDALLTAIQRTRGMEGILAGERSGIEAVAVSPDGGLIATANAAGRIVVWDAEARVPLGDPIDLDGEALAGSLAFDPSATVLAAGMTDGSVWLAEVSREGEPSLLGFTSEGYTIQDLVFTESGAKLLAVTGEEVRVWDLETGQTEHQIQLNAGLGAGFGEDVFLAGNGEAYVGLGAGVGAAANGELIAIFQPSEAAGPRGRVSLVEVGSGESVSAIDVELGASVFALSADGRFLAYPDSTHAVAVMDTATGERRSVIPARGSEVSALRFSPDAGRLAVGRENGIAEIFDAETGAPIGPEFEGHASRVSDLAFAEDGSRVVSVGGDGLAILWSPNGDSPLARVLFSPPALELPSARIHDTAVSPDSSLVGVTTEDGVIHLIETESGRQIGEIEGRTGEDQAVLSSLGLAFSPDGATLATFSGGNGVLRLWDVSTRQALGGPLEVEIDKTSAGPGYVTFSPDGAMLATWPMGRWSAHVQLWDASERQPLGEPLGFEVGIPSPVLSGVDFGPDGRQVAVALDDGTIGVFDAERPTASPQILRGHEAYLWDLDVSPDGRFASASDDGTLRLWDKDGAANGEPLAATARSLAFAPDGRTLQTLGLRDLVVWDLEQRATLGDAISLDKFPAGEESFLGSKVDVLPDGSASVVLLGRFVMRLDSLLWSEDVDRLVGHVCSLVGHGLRRSDWESLIPDRDYRQGCPQEAPPLPAAATGEAVESDPPPHEQWSREEGGLYTTQSVFVPGFAIDFGQMPFDRFGEAGEGVTFGVHTPQTSTEDDQGSYLSVLNSSAVPSDPRDVAAGAVEFTFYQPPLDPAAEGVDLAAWLQQHPRLRVSDERQTTVGGVSARQFDLTVRPEAAYSSAAECFQVKCVYILSEPTYWLPVTNKLRVVALDVDGEQIVILIEAPKAMFEVWAEEAERIVSTLIFEPDRS